MAARKRKVYFGITAALVVVALFVMGQIDFERVVAGKDPMFARSRSYLMDGGSTEFSFAGYTVTRMNRMYGPTPNGSGARYRVGTKLDYWIPFVGRDNTMVIVRTNR